MAKGTIGSPFTFNVLFLDSAGDPLVPLAGASIEIFYFDVDGAKQTLLAAGSAMAAVMGDTGRYVRTLTIPSDLSAAFQLYGIMKAVDPGTGMELVAEQSVDLVSIDSSNGSCNYRASFVKPPGFL